MKSLKKRLESHLVPATWTKATIFFSWSNGKAKLTDPKDVYSINSMLFLRSEYEIHSFDGNNVADSSLSSSLCPAAACLYRCKLRQELANLNREHAKRLVELGRIAQRNLLRLPLRELDTLNPYGLLSKRLFLALLLELPLGHKSIAQQSKSIHLSSSCLLDALFYF